MRSFQQSSVSVRMRRCWTFSCVFEWADVLLFLKSEKILNDLTIHCILHTYMGGQEGESMCVPKFFSPSGWNGSNFRHWPRGWSLLDYLRAHISVSEMEDGRWTAPSVSKRWGSLSQVTPVWCVGNMVERQAWAVRRTVSPAVEALAI